MMSNAHVIVRDAQQSLHSVIDEDVMHAMIGSLSADPETLSELQAALTRFMHAEVAGGLFATWTPGDDLAADTQPICVIELAARMIVSSWKHELEDGVAATPYVGPQGVSERWHAYHLSDDWLLTSDLQHWRTLAEQRREQQVSQPRVDLRQILYGEPLLELIVRDCAAAVGSSQWRLSEVETAATLSGRYRLDNPAYRAAREIHARWLTTPQPRLQGRSLHDEMLSQRVHIARDIEHRAQQWVCLGHCPPGLSERDTAYRWAGLGPHEIIVYYDLVRHLLFRCLDRFVQLPTIDGEAEVQWLRDVRDDWLSQPQPDSTGNTPPRDVIDRERRRLPLVDTEDGSLDCDCPLCRLLAEPGAGPAFSYLGGYHLDEDFAFSFCRTREDWNREYGDRDEDHEFDEPDQGQADDEDDELAMTELSLSLSSAGNPPSSVWKRSYVNPEILAESPSTRLFGVGTYLSEIISDLKQQDESRALIDGLNRQYDNLCQLMRPGQQALMQPVLHRFCEQLQEVIDTSPELIAKCQDLQEKIRQWFSGEGDDPAVE